MDPPIVGSKYSSLRERHSRMVNWSVHPDGRFLMLRTAQTPDTAQIVVIENFHEVLEETVPPLD